MKEKFIKNVITKPHPRRSTWEVLAQQRTQRCEATCLDVVSGYSESCCPYCFWGESRFSELVVPLRTQDDTLGVSPEP